jgi:hypothetical protein
MYRVGLYCLLERLFSEEKKEPIEPIVVPNAIEWTLWRIYRKNWKNIIHLSDEKRN